MEQNNFSNGVRCNASTIPLFFHPRNMLEGIKELLIGTSKYERTLEERNLLNIQISLYQDRLKAKTLKQIPLTDSSRYIGRTKNINSPSNMLIDGESMSYDELPEEDIIEVFI